MPSLRSLGFLLALTLAAFGSSSLSAQSFTFGAAHSIALPSSTLSYPIGLDMNGDGNKDVYIQLQTGNYVYLADGKGNLSSTPIKVHESVTGFLFPPVFYDVNGDGIADEIYSYPGYFSKYPGEGYNGVFAVLLGDGKGNFTESTNLTVSALGGDNGVLVTGDFNGDGKLDFATLSGGDLSDGPQPEIDVFLNTGGGQFQFGYQEFLGDEGPSGGLVRGDFNGDGKEDLVYAVVNAENEYDVHCLDGNGKGSFTDQVCYTLGAAPASFGSADFNRDGKTDLVVSLYAQRDANGNPVAGAKPSLTTLLAKDGGFTLSSSVVLPSAGPGPLQIAEMNGDGKPDVITDADYVFKNDGNGIFSTAQRVPDTDIILAIVKDGLPASINLTTGSTYYLMYRLNTSKP